MKHVEFTDIADLKRLFERAWCRETATGGIWREDVPSMNQCAVTALVVNDLIGGKIARQKLSNDDSHYYNYDPGGGLIDLTSDQLSYLNVHLIPGSEVIMSRGYILSYANTMRRYGLLLMKIGLVCLEEPEPHYQW